MSRALKCLITSPQGVEYDVSRLLEIGELSAISFAPEDDLAQMHHGDMALSLDDSQGDIHAMLQGAGPTDVYDVKLSRERNDGTGWDRLFGGILDLISLNYDNKTKVASIGAWSYSKLLERTPADTITRTLAAKTASINSGSRVMAFLAGASETSDILAGDSVKLTDTQGHTETFVVDSITDDENLLVSEDAGTTLTDCVAVVTTPFYRDQTPETIAGLIAAEVDMDLDGSDFDVDLASYPILTPLVVIGGASVAQPTSLVPTGTTIVATYDSTDNTNRKSCASPSTPWTDGTATNDYQRDWTPYLTAEPGTIYDDTPADSFARSADAQIQRGSMGSSWAQHYVAECVVYSTGLDSTAGDKWQLFADTHVVGPTQYSRLSLYLNGVSQIVAEDIANGAVGAVNVGTFCGWIEFDTFNKFPWFSYQYTPVGSTDPTVRKLCMYISAAHMSAPQIRELSTTKSGQVRFSRGFGASGHLLLYDCPISLSTGSAGSGTLYVYDTSNMLITFTLPADATIAFTLGYPQLWTARYWSGYLVFLFQQIDAVRIALYDVTDLTAGARFVAAYTVSADIKTFRCYLTIFALTDARTIIAGYAGGEWFVLSLRYDGVIRYADFLGKSCADAAAQLAITTNCIVNVDAFRTLSLKNRRGLGRGDSIRDIGTPIEDHERPTSEVWRSSVGVKGTLNTGGAIDVIVGDEGDSANRLNISSDLVTTSGMAVATAVATLQFVSAIRSQHDSVVADADGALKFGDRVTLSGKDLVVYKGSVDIEQETQHLTLLEVVA
jgi:hypothetical protein